MPDVPERLAQALADRYTLEREIGSGGMAVVYLAHDVRHNRPVAVKVLRPDLAAALGADRFVREIEIAANLTHPHILPLHDSGESEGFLYYVMPYIEGDTLRQRLDREGELPVAEAVRIVREVADALAFAHSRGVVHRDIKPDNVMLSGRHALVTDFGVAKAVSEATGRNALTTAGVALGTPTYMSPEQATADPHVDHRTDIYAVGVLAYELLTGRPPFTGATPQAVLAAHVTEEAQPVSKHRNQVSRDLEAVVMRCLAKKPADRFQTADEILPYLETTTSSGGITPTATHPASPAPPADRGRKKVIYAAVGAVLVLALAATWQLSNRGYQYLVPGERRQVTRDKGLEIDPAISPDGQRVAYAAGPRDRMQIYVRQVGGGRVLPLTEEFQGPNRWPQWSPDGSQILFTRDAGGTTGAERGIYLVPAFGGPARQVARGRGATWSPDGAEVAYVDGDSLYAVAAAGGTPRAIAQVREGHSPAWSPDGAVIALVEGNGDFVWGSATFGNIASSGIAAVRVDDGEKVDVAPWGASMNMSPAWTPAGDLLFVSDREGSRDIYQVRIDDRGRPIGEPQRLTVGADAHSLRMAADGASLVYSAYNYSSNLWAYDVPRSGTITTRDGRPVTAQNQVLEYGDLSPDGQWLVYDTDRFGNQDIFKRPVAGGDEIQLTSDPGDDFAPMWSPDGTELVFYSMRHGTRDVFVMNADGSALTRVTDDEEGHERYPRWSPDGNRLAYFASTRSFLSQVVFVVSRAGRTAPWGEPVLFSRAAEAAGYGAAFPSWSPDGSRLAFLSHGLQVAPVDDPDATSTMVVDPASGPPGSEGQDVFWSAEHRTIFFKTWDPEGGAIWGVPEDAVTAGAPVPGRRYLVFDDPLLTPRHTFVVRQGQFLVTIGEHESDIWVVDLE